MRVMFVITAMGRGGAEIQVRDLALGLVARGHQVAVVVMLPFADFERDLRLAGVETLSLEMRRGWPDPKAFLALAAFSRRFAPDIVHGHMFAGVCLARLARCLPTAVRGTWRAVVSTSHSGFELPRARYLAYRLTSPMSELWTSVSQDGLDVHRAQGALGRHRAISVPNGVDTDRFSPDAAARTSARRALGLEDVFTWLALVSFRDEGRKDFDTLFQALRTVEGAPPSILLLAGEGRLLEEKKALAARLGLAHRVRFLGLRTDVVDLLRAADAYVSSSRSEGMPIVLLEAGACGLPIVTTDVGACADIVSHGHGGFVVPPANSARLADAMSDVEALPGPDRERMGTKARQRVLERFSLSMITAQWESLYAGLVRQV